MQKRILSAVSVISVAAVVLCVAGCAKKNVAKDNSLSVVDNNGEKYFAVTNADGFIEKNEKNEMKIYAVLDGEKVTEKNSGEYITQSVSFPFYAVNGKTIYTQNFNFKIPDGWKQTDADSVKIEYSSEKSKAELSLVERISESQDECIVNIRRTMSVLGITPKKSTEKFDFAEAEILSYKEYKENTDLVFTVFTVKDKTYYVKVSANTQAKKSVDFNKIINSIMFR